MTAKPRIITRSEWGADERLRNCGPSYAPNLKMAFVHHTAGVNSYTRGESAGIVRAIYWYHTQVRGWCDIGYNFLVDKYGQIFEGRYGGMARPVVPAATRGFNTGTVAVSAIGNYQTAYPPKAMRAALERVLAWRMDVAHISPLSVAHMTSGGGDGNRFPAGHKVWFRKVSGHRDANYTECPGSHLYALLARIRNAAFYIGLPKIFNPRQSRGVITPASTPVVWRAGASRSIRWHLQVEDDNGTTVRSWSPWGRSLSVAWDGTAMDGTPVAPGRYTVRLSGVQRSHTARAAAFDLAVDAAGRAANWRLASLPAWRGRRPLRRPAPVARQRGRAQSRAANRSR
jgi:hypothetical protein